MAGGDEEYETNAKTAVDEARRLIASVADAYDADIYLYSAPIDHDGFGKVVGCYDGKNRSNALLILTTNGGLANSAYKIARFFQTEYDEFILFIPSYCKSAGTLIACGAHRLIMNAFSELGPLDVQLYARDEIGSRRSGLLNHSAFEALKEETFSLYESFMLNIKLRSYDRISFSLASEVAGDMAAKLMAPVFEQISPEALGSDYRDLQVAVEYGQRLAYHGNNIQPEFIDHLTNGFPAHDFIIDAWEAREMFDNVEEPSRELYGLLSLVGSMVFTEGEIVACLTEAAGKDDDEEPEPDMDDSAEADLGGAYEPLEEGATPPEHD